MQIALISCRFELLVILDGGRKKSIPHININFKNSFATIPQPHLAFLRLSFLLKAEKISAQNESYDNFITYSFRFVWRDFSVCSHHCVKWDGKRLSGVLPTCLLIFKLVFAFSASRLLTFHIRREGSNEQKPPVELLGSILFTNSNFLSFHVSVWPFSIFVVQKISRGISARRRSRKWFALSADLRLFLPLKGDTAVNNWFLAFHSWRTGKVPELN